jgi:hypothetical protein
MDEGFRESECLPPGVLRERINGLWIPPTALFPEGGILQIAPRRFYPIRGNMCHLWDRIIPTPTQWAHWLQSWQDYANQWNLLCSTIDPPHDPQATMVQ